MTALICRLLVQEVREVRRQMSNVCFLCKGNSTGNDSLRKVCSLEMDLKVRKCATALLNTSFLAALSDGDLCARRGKYHLKCLSNLYNRYRAHSTHTIRTADNNEEKLCLAMVFGELVDYIQGKLEIKDADYVFKLSDLASLYDKRLAQLLDREVEKGHSTRLKEKILMHFPTFRAHKQGKECVLLPKNVDIPGNAISDDSNLECEAVAFFRFIKQLRKQKSSLSLLFEEKF